MRKNLYSHYKKKKWKLGKWYKTKGGLSMCSNGFHASERIIDSMQYVPMEILAKVEVRGEYLEQPGKQCWEEMRIVRAWKWEKKDSVALAIYAAGLVLENFEKLYPDDKRPREAIQVARRWLKNPAKNSLSAWPAESAARSAAWSAAWSAESAARSAGSAAESAARSAAESARSAAWSARSAAGSAAWSALLRSAAESEKILDKINVWIKKRINKLEKLIEVKND